MKESDFNYEIIDTNNKKWNDIVYRASCFDFHHTSDYHLIASQLEAKLLYFYKNKSFIAFPILLKRENNFSNLESIYGYPGPISFFENEVVEKELISFFQDAFFDYCNKQNIKTVVSRLNPFINNQTKILNNKDHIINLKKIVYLDLREPHQYRNSLKYEIRKLSKFLTTTEASYKNDIDGFIEIYYETMKRVNAESKYYFSRKYFFDLLASKAFEAKLLIIKIDGKIAAGAIFIISHCIMHYHLSATASNHLKESPIKLIIDSARLLGMQRKLKYLNLGGGTNCENNDSLYYFKSGFSKRTKLFSIYKTTIQRED